MVSSWHGRRAETGLSLQMSSNHQADIRCRDKSSNLGGSKRTGNDSLRTTTDEKAKDNKHEVPRGHVAKHLGIRWF